MNRLSGFTALPNELLLLIGDEISDDPRTLKALTLVSKRYHDFFNSFLYRDVCNKALPTLALSEQSRLPLTGTHPASYVKKFSVSPTHKLSATVFQKQMASAMKNIALHAATGAIQALTFRSNFSLPEVLGGNVPLALRLLEELVLKIPILVKNTRLNVSLVDSLCGPSLIAARPVFLQSSRISL
ncbi:hypothetical protein BT96DRAFT_62744 [Gymnopus androsaceus JB14]|uniref:Uncharacterized protein n=1 Tax=Gymnopus androsaceus JB14 TaxID=1447944 RepID=A0A6A4HIB2_9AGAR|nr:hypothetical protein BT96DRAFT_62744 [Gymnopus androsaceus JB14]